MGVAVELNKAATGEFLSVRLERVFNRCFLDSENTVLLGGADEPVYQPSDSPGEQHRLYYREDFFASALHEIAHWCIAGPERRKLLDFGYWYAPEGRNSEQQKAFEQVEIKPQALEWILSQACGFPFRVSVDNLDPLTGQLPDTGEFRRRVTRRALAWQQGGPGSRAEQLFRALAEEFDTGATIATLRFSADLID